MMDGSGISLRVMRHAALPLVMLLGLSAPVGAQVTLDLHALDALPAGPARPAQLHVHRRAERPPARHTETARARAPKLAASQPAAKASPPPVAAVVPTVPTTPPPAPPATVATIAPPAPPAPPTASVPAPPSIAASASAPDRTLGVAFAAGQSDLTAPDAEALASLAHDTPRGDTTSFEVAAYAPATAGDASTARRLSLARALAVRGALVGAGVPAASIYVRALGAPRPGQPGGADRAVVTVMGANGAEQKQASQR